MFHDPTLDYHAARAQQEAIRSLASDHEVVAGLHQELCLLHCARFVAATLFRRTG